MAVVTCVYIPQFRGGFYQTLGGENHAHRCARLLLSTSKRTLLDIGRREPCALLRAYTFPHWKENSILYYASHDFHYARALYLNLNLTLLQIGRRGVALLRRTFHRSSIEVEGIVAARAMTPSETWSYTESV